MAFRLVPRRAAGYDENLMEGRLMRVRQTAMVLAIGALLTAAPAAAQTFDAGIKVGVAVTGLPHAGEVFDQVVGHPSSETSSRIGLTAGGYVRFPVTDQFGFQPEALLVMRGVQMTEASGGGSVKVRVYYLDIPLLARYRRSLDSDTIGYLLAGPSFGIKIGSSAKLEAAGQTVDEDMSPALKTLDLGLAFGGGIERDRYLVEGRFTAGVTDIASASFPHLDSLRNRTFSVLFGYKLRQH
jgi:hypothetical protein